MTIVWINNGIVALYGDYYSICFNGDNVLYNQDRINFVIAVGVVMMGS